MKYKFLTFMGNSITTMSQFQVQRQPKAKILKQVMFIFPTSVPQSLSGAFLCFFFFLIIFTFLGCAGSSLLHTGFLKLHRVGATL